MSGTERGLGWLFFAEDKTTHSGIVRIHVQWYAVIGTHLAQGFPTDNPKLSRGQTQKVASRYCSCVFTKVLQGLMGPWLSFALNSLRVSPQLTSNCRKGRLRTPPQSLPFFSVSSSARPSWLMPSLSVFFFETFFSAFEPSAQAVAPPRVPLGVPLGVPPAQQPCRK